MNIYNVIDPKIKSVIIIFNIELSIRCMKVTIFFELGFERFPKFIPRL